MEVQSVRSHQLEVLWFDFAERLASTLCYWGYHTCYFSCNWKCSTLTPSAFWTFRKQKPVVIFCLALCMNLGTETELENNFLRQHRTTLSSGSSFFLMKCRLVIHTSLLLKCTSCRLCCPVLFCSNSSSCGHLFGQVREDTDVHMYKRG